MPFKIRWLDRGPVGVCQERESRAADGQVMLWQEASAVCELWEGSVGVRVRGVSPMLFPCEREFPFLSGTTLASHPPSPQTSVSACATEWPLQGELEMASSVMCRTKREMYPKGQELAGHVGVSRLLWTQTLHGNIKWEPTGELLPESCSGSRCHEIILCTLSSVPVTPSLILFLPSHKTQPCTCVCPNFIYYPNSTSKHGQQVRSFVSVPALAPLLWVSVKQLVTCPPALQSRKKSK